MKQKSVNLNLVKSKFLIIILLLAIFSNIVFGFQLALDVGHTNLQSGAKSCTGKTEYFYNTQLTDFLTGSLKKNNSIEITSNLKIKNVSFDDRYKMSYNKDLLISIHHDSVQQQFLKYNDKKFPQTNYAKGYSIFISRKNKFYEQSLLYAKNFSQSLLESGLKPSLHHNEKINGENRELLDKKLGIYIFDDLKVLKHSSSPAFLFEAGVIVNPIDERLVCSNEYKQKFLNAILLMVGIHRI